MHIYTMRRIEMGFFGGFEQKMKNASEVSNLNGKIQENEKLIEQYYTILGKLYFEKFGESAEGEAETICKQIKSFLDEIESLKSALLVARGLKLCPGCNAECAIDVPFCSACGTKLPMPEPSIPAASDVSFCSACGGKINADCAFCPSCGKPVAKAEPAPIVPAVPPMVVPAMENFEEQEVVEPIEEIAESVMETVAEPIAETVAEPIMETVAEPINEFPATVAVVGEPEVVAEPIAETVAEPIMETVAEPIMETVAQPEAEVAAIPEAPVGSLAAMLESMNQMAQAPVAEPAPVAEFPATVAVVQPTEQVAQPVAPKVETNIPEGMKVCTKCGAFVVERALFCGNCGSKF